MVSKNDIAVLLNFSILQSPSWDNIMILHLQVHLFVYIYMYRTLIIGRIHKQYLIAGKLGRRNVWQIHPPMILVKESLANGSL